MIQRTNSDLDLEERFTGQSNRLPQKDLAQLVDAYRDLLDGIGEDLDREGLRRTPDRAARALEFLTQGYRQDLDEIIDDLSGTVWRSSGRRSETPVHDDAWR